MRRNRSHSVEEHDLINLRDPRNLTHDCNTCSGISAFLRKRSNSVGEHHLVLVGDRRNIGSEVADRNRRTYFFKERSYPSFRSSSSSSNNNNKRSHPLRNSFLNHNSYQWRSSEPSSRQSSRKSLDYPRHSFVGNFIHSAKEIFSNPLSIPPSSPLKSIKSPRFGHLTMHEATEIILSTDGQLEIIKEEIRKCGVYTNVGAQQVLLQSIIQKRFIDIDAQWKDQQNVSEKNDWTEESERKDEKSAEMTDTPPPRLNNWTICKTEIEETPRRVSRLRLPIVRRGKAA